MINDIEKILVQDEVLKNKVKELGRQITKDYKDSKDLVLVGILKGCVIFMSDLIREINLHAKLDFMIASSYGLNSVSSGEIKIKKDLDIDIKGKDVIIIEDIIDTGITLHALKKTLLKREPKSLKVCALLDKPDRRLKDVTVDYPGFNIPDEFVVGYGLDFAEKYRNLPFIGVLKEEMYR